MNLLDSLATDCLYAPDQDMWVRLEADGTARLGATHLIAAHGKFMLFTPRPNGSEIERDRSLGVMETTKTAIAIHAPLSCRIIESNDSAIDNIHYVITDPYGAGWLYRVQPLALEAERSTLLDASAYREWIAPRMAERMIDAVDEFKLDDFDIDPHRGY
ncbi:MAG: glycine cleavage system protein H [Burkholderiaceae bacterium]